MFSIPPATTTSLSPALIDCAASITALRPEPQTLLTVKAPTLTGIPAWIADCRAGFCPSPADMTFPMITSSISFASIPALLRDSLTAIAPNLGAGIPTRLLPNFPIAVLQADRITGSDTLRVSPPLVLNQSMGCAVTHNSPPPLSSRDQDEIVDEELHYELPPLQVSPDAEQQARVEPPLDG